MLSMIVTLELLNVRAPSKGIGMRLSYYCYDASVCQVFLEKIRGMFGVINMSIDPRVLANPNFVKIASPERADFILFPFDIGILIELMGVEQTEALLADIPLYVELQEKHVLFDYGDRCTVLPTKAVVFKVSMRFPYDKNYFPLWYMTSAHVTNDHYVWNFENTKYDICFMGINSNPLRKAACVSLTHTSKLRSYIDIVDGAFENGVFYLPQLTSEELAARQVKFRNSIKISKCSFCPPGLGPHSVRFFESLYYGRIPVVVGDANIVFPFHTALDYSQFCVTVNRADIAHIGDIVYDFLNATSKDGLRAMSLRACKVYHTVFSNDAIPKYIHTTLCSYLHAQSRV